ncbi:MAG: YjjI family glycine radical enzyme [Erysipelotrichaceae bacterium]|nr:YjjI family glycine radical enzyme [Erysipelotrichaceae bacterium]
MGDCKLCQKQIEEIMNDTKLTYWQRTDSLAKYAENLLDYPEGTPKEFYELLKSGEICDLFEGHGPKCPRYILPDYKKFLKEGSSFLRIEPAKTLYEAVNSLQIFYHNAHSIDRFPVFLGRLDDLLEEYVIKEDRDEAKKILKWFLINIDRTMSDSFVQANLGPEETVTGNIILELLPELQNITPNMTLRYDPNITPDDFAKKALDSALRCANPAFALDEFYKERVGEEYGIASCYNGLLIGGGAFTLTRLRLGTIAANSRSYDDFFENRLPLCIDTQLKFMDAKIRNVVENRAFFSSDWMVKEGFVYKDKFVGLFGLVGLYECVNTLMEKSGKTGRMGHDEEADQLGVKILEAIEKAVNEHYCPYSYKHRFVMHSQVGADGDEGNSAGTRIAYGDEPQLYEHLRNCGLYHRFFPSGVGDIFPFDETAFRNLDALLDIFKGGFKVGVKYMSTYLGSGDLIRVTGYLVKRSEVEKLKKGEVVANDSIALVVDKTPARHLNGKKVQSFD